MFRAKVGKLQQNNVALNRQSLGDAYQIVTRERTECLEIQIEPYAAANHQQGHSKDALPLPCWRLHLAERLTETGAIQSLLLLD